MATTDYTIRVMYINNTTATFTRPTKKQAEALVTELWSSYSTKHVVLVCPTTPAA